MPSQAFSRRKLKLDGSTPSKWMKVKGPETIVVAMDIGTTTSAVSFAYFCPGSRPQTKMVAHWPSQSRRNSTAKTPTVVSYRNGAATAYGTEAEEEIEKQGKNAAYWFKVIA
ncbi:hypothetical protein M408DRAFT_262586 [Serendipita vermifera MAFF 305830]|uniref:Uncharacterized protein n=1 Tax=Serendipita vermifera MAFF 305830 TaxID=933852 RepID=A0A0C3AU06_SERVB|nr:hypothetical protein M408DRAFT_262586 [Serendipita vermifera MAFF 305830]